MESTEEFNPANEGYFGECVEAGAKELFHVSFAELNKLYFKGAGRSIEEEKIVALAMVGRVVLDLKNAASAPE